MRVLSLNAWGGAMFDALAAWLPSCDADVVCLQEVTRTPGTRGWTRFADRDRTLPQRADLFADVAGVLPGHQGYFQMSETGPVHGPDGRLAHQDFGIATFVHGRVEVVDTSSAFVHGAYTHHGVWPSSEQRPRAAHGVRLIERSTGAAVTVVHLHGLRDPAGKWDTAARRRQAERLAAFVSGLRVPGDVVVVCGDLNVLPDSETLDVLGRLGLTDLVGETDTRTSHYSKPVRHASYMLVSDPDRVRDFDVVRTPEVSDHRALRLDL